MSQHTHESCEHELKYCKKCAVVYCDKCKKEWNDHIPSYYPYYPTAAAYQTYPIWLGDTGDPLPQPDRVICQH